MRGIVAVLLILAAGGLLVFSFKQFKKNSDYKETFVVKKEIVLKPGTRKRVRSSKTGKVRYITVGEKKKVYYEKATYNYKGSDTKAQRAMKRSEAERLAISRIESKARYDKRQFYTAKKTPVDKEELMKSYKRAEEFLREACTNLSVSTSLQRRAFDVKRLLKKAISKRLKMPDGKESMMEEVLAELEREAQKRNLDAVSRLYRKWYDGRISDSTYRTLYQKYSPDRDRSSCSGGSCP